MLKTEDRILDANETAAQLGISPSTLAKWRMQGASPRYLKVGRAVRFRQSDIDAWLATRSVASTSEFSARKAS